MFGFGIFFGIFMLLLWVAFWGGIVALIIWGVRKLAGSHESGRYRPVDIARERYARGEISKEEFEQLRNDLS